MQKTSFKENSFLFIFMPMECFMRNPGRTVRCSIWITITLIRFISEPEKMWKFFFLKSFLQLFLTINISSVLTHNQKLGYST